MPRPWNEGDELKLFQDALDQVSFVQQGGRNKHEDICTSLEMFAREVMPEFKEHETECQKRKAEELAPYIEKAMKRKRWAEQGQAPLDDPLKKAKSAD